MTVNRADIGTGLCTYAIYFYIIIFVVVIFLFYIYASCLCTKANSLCLKIYLAINQIQIFRRQNVILVTIVIMLIWVLFRVYSDYSLIYHCFWSSQGRTSGYCEGCSSRVCLCLNWNQVSLAALRLWGRGRLLRVDMEAIMPALC